MLRWKLGSNGTKARVVAVEAKFIVEYGSQVVIEVVRIEGRYADLNLNLGDNDNDKGILASPICITRIGPSSRWLTVTFCGVFTP
jgi:hypothetical protein